ncbi:MAG TPA: acyltransferase [Nocardioidaceae bacterium]|nr:acyltransferase [Nocardioidaceae bacterium]
MTAATPARPAAPVLGSLRWVVRHRAWTPYHLVRYWRFALFKLRHPNVRTEGLVFLGRRVEVSVRRGYGRVVLGRWVHLGEDTRLRCHEGTLRIGDKSVFGRDSTVNCYLDVEIGPATMVSDSVYICDFDHVTARLDLPIKDQGIVKAPVRIGGGSWVGTKVTVLRGTEVGRGSVVAAGAVVRGTFPDHSVLAGVPARLVKVRAARPGDGSGAATSSTAGTTGTAEPRGVSGGHIVRGTPPAS